LILVLTGLGPVVTIQAVTDVPLVVPDPPDLPLPVADPQAAASRAAATPAAASGHRWRANLGFDLIDGDMISSWPGARGFEIFRKFRIAGYPR
jgi:hypothetical protein